MGTLASVHIYPLKGCRAIDVGEWVVEPWGLAGDRRWLAVGSDYGSSASGSTHRWRAWWSGTARYPASR